MMYDTWYEPLEELRRYMKEQALSVPVFHADKSVGDLISRHAPGDVEEAYRRFDINCAFAAELGADRMVLHLWGGIDSDRDMAHTLSAYPALHARAESAGLLLTVENVVCNHADPMTHLASLAEAYPDVAFTFDTKMAHFHRQLDELYAPENEKICRRIRHLHINDYGGGCKDWSNLDTLHPGEGSVDFDRFFSFLRVRDYTGDFTVEATSFDRSGAIHTERLNATFAYLRARLALN